MLNGSLVPHVCKKPFVVCDWNLPFYLQYLTKQTATLREVNESRAKIYEQLEVSISELENTNQKLVEENQTDKVKIKR